MTSQKVSDLELTYDFHLTRCCVCCSKRLCLKEDELLTEYVEAEVDTLLESEDLEYLDGETSRFYLMRELLKLRLENTK